MTKRIVLHAGLPKCGSTSLQLRLASNRAALAERGIHYPPATPSGAPGLQHMALATALIEASRPAAKSACQLLARTLADFEASGAETMMLSSESFAMRAERLQPHAFGELLTPYAVELLLFVRRRDRWLLSFYKQCVRVAPRLYRGTLAEFAAAPPPYAAAIAGPIASRATARLAELTGAARVHVVDLDTGSLDTRQVAGDLIGAPLTTMADDPALLPAFETALQARGLPTNASLSDVRIAFLRAIDRRRFAPGMLLDLDVALTTAELDAIAPNFAIMDQALSRLLIAEGEGDRAALHAAHGTPLPQDAPAGRLVTRERLTEAEWRAIADRIGDRLEPRTQAALAEASTALSF